MGVNILDMDFERWNVNLLAFLPALINLLILVYSGLYFNKSRLNSTFSIFVLFLVIWQITTGFVMTSQSIETATIWYRLSETSILFVVIFGNLFVFRFTGLNKIIPDIYIFLCLLFPAIFFIICIQLKLDAFSIIASENFYWIVSPETKIITNLIYFWLAIFGMVMVVVIWFFYFKSTNGSIKRKQFLILGIGFSFPIIGGIIAEIIFPLFLKIDSVPITISLVTSFSIASLISIKKYSMLDFSPIHQWHNIIESMNEGLVIVDNNNKIMYANSEFCKISGYSFEELNGNISDKLLVDNEEARLQNNNYNKKANVDYSFEYEVELKTKTGEYIWMLLSRTPYKDVTGNVIGSIVFYTNINQIKEANNSLKNANSELELYVYKASHDLRSPLASMLGLIYVWKSETNDPTTINYLNMLEVTGKKLDFTLFELVKAMKIKGIKEFTDNIDFNEIINEIFTKFSHYPGYDRMTIESQIDIKDSFVSNKFIIETILQNLIENVIKYQKHTISNPFINICIKEENKKVVLIVKDNGIGIEESIQSKVFDMYFRGTLDSKGSGLGLYLVKKSVEKLNGNIHLQSKEGVGTTFTVNFN